MHCLPHGREAQAAHWIAAGRLAQPEQLDEEIEPRGPSEIYFFNRFIPNVINRVVDVSSTIETKMKSIRANRTMIAHMALRLKDQLATQNLSLPILSVDVDTAVIGFSEFFRQRTEAAGEPFGLKYAEPYRYRGPRTKKKSFIQKYIEENAVPIK